MSRIVIAGGSGFIGQAITRLYTAKGWDVVVLSRSERPPQGNVRTVAWDAKSVGPWAKELDGADLVVNLTGESIAIPWTTENRKKILDSRIESAHAIGAAIRQAANKPGRWINASAIGYYGDTSDTEVDENGPPGDPNSFLVETCKAWELAATDSCVSEVPLTILRIGIVQGNEGGAFPKLFKLARAFLGGAVGSGHQFQSWIHVDDLAAMIAWIADTAQDGIINGVAPGPAPMSEYMATLREVAGRPWSPPVPGFALKIASAFGGPPPEIILSGQRVRPSRALAGGFSYQFPHLKGALKELAKKSS